MINIKKKEIWISYPEYTCVEVSNLGRVRTKDRWVPNGKNSKRLVKGRVLKQQLNNYGYLYVHFRANGRNIFLLVHRMVAICFLPNPNNYPEVNHKDNNPQNNEISNLEWCTDQYNQAYKNNFGKSPAQIQGRPVIAVSLDTFDAFWFESQHEASRQLSIDVENINAVVKGKRKKTHGWWFCYADERAVKKTREKFGDEIANKVRELMRKSEK